MGSWWYGTWDNDTACGLLGDTVHKLKRLIEMDLKSAQSKRDYIIERPVLAAVAMMRALIVESRSSYLLPRRTAKAWRDHYLAWFDKPEVTGAHRNPRASRRRAEKEFQRLIRCASPDRSAEELEEEIAESEKPPKRKRKLQKRS